MSTNNTGREMSGRLASQNQYPTPITVAIAVFLIFFLTYVSTSISFRLATGSKASTIKAPIKPYWIPYFGSLIAFVKNAEQFFWNIRQYNSIPIHIKLGPEEMIIFSGSENLQTIFSRSRDLSTKALTMLTLVTCFGLPPKDAKIYEDDDSGLLPKQLPGANVLPEKRIFHMTHRNFHYNLSGTALEELSRQFLRLFARGIARKEEVCGDGWLELPDLFGFVRHEAFVATTSALCGEHILLLNPSMAEDFWTFDSWLPSLVKKIPRWMIPRAFEIRDKNHKNIMKWHEYAQQHLNPADENMKDVLWEPIWGAKVMRERGAYRNNISEMSKAGHAADDLGMIWGANGNAAPAAAWSVYHTVSDKSLVARIRKEITPAFSSSSPASVNLAKLNTCPLLQSIVAEVLRLYGTVLIHRTSTIPDFKLGKWLIEPGKLMISSSYHAHHDEQAWNTGSILPNGKQEHPLDEFWADRFLEYPNDPLSGPMKKEVSEKPNVTELIQHNDKEAKYVSENLKGVYIPWGGGTNMCPGRHYAKNEMLLAVAMMIWAFDVEFVDEEIVQKVRPTMAAFAIGALSADRKIPVRLRKRVSEASGN